MTRLAFTQTIEDIPNALTPPLAIETTHEIFFIDQEHNGHIQSLHVSHDQAIRLVTVLNEWMRK